MKRRLAVERNRTGGLSGARLLSLVVFSSAFLVSATVTHADFDAGDIAVLETDPTILQPGEDFDLSGKALTFTPKPAGGYTISVAPGSVDTSNLGANLALGDDQSSTAQSLGFVFPFFGTNYSSVFVNSNGYVTFGGASALINFNPCNAPDLSTVLDRISEGFPGIAVLWNDLNPSAGGGVFFNALGDRALVTWNNVPRFGQTTPNTFQLALFPSGAVQVIYGSIGPASTDPKCGGHLVGISPGGAYEFLVTSIDFSTGRGGSVSAFPRFEPLVQVFGSLPNPLVHISAVARRFYRTHADGSDQLVMVANFPNALDEAFAFELPIRISMAGTGQEAFDNSSWWGSNGRLHSFLNMNELSLYPANPNTTFLGTNSTLDLMGQEAGHQWLAFLRFNDGGTTSDLLLGRDLAHWSFFMDSDASDMEGNDWADNGNGTFTSTDATSRYSALDQYAMGLRPASAVPNVFFIRDPSTVGCRVTDQNVGERSCAPQIGVTATGTRQNGSVSQVVAVEGTRAAGFTGVNPTNVWHQAFILLVGAGTTVPPADLAKIEEIRAAWVPYFNVATDQRGTIDTSLGATSTTSSTTTSTIRPSTTTTTASTTTSTVTTSTTTTSTTSTTVPSSSLSVSDCKAAPGQTATCGVTLTLAGGAQVATLQFNATVVPTGAAPALANAVGFTGDSSLPVPTMVQNNGNGTVLVAWLSSISPALTGTRRLGTLTVPVPAGAQVGQSYGLQIIAPSGTSDGITDVPMAPGPDGTLTVAAKFLVCDVAPVGTDLNGDGNTFDAGEFGDGLLNNADIVRLFRASLLLSERPPAGRDLFSAMDAAPEDHPPVCGGDGAILNNDAVTCFRRSLLPALPRYARQRAGGTCVSMLAPSTSAAADVAPPLVSSTDTPSRAPKPSGSVVPVSTGRGRSGHIIKVPIRLLQKSRRRAVSLQFAVQVAAEGVASGLVEPPRFVPAPGQQPPDLQLTEGDVVLVGWLHAAPRFARKRIRIGTVLFRVPPGASRGDVYTIRISEASGTAADGDAVTFASGAVSVQAAGGKPR